MNSPSENLSAAQDLLVEICAKKNTPAAMFKNISDVAEMVLGIDHQHATGVMNAADAVPVLRDILRVCKGLLPQLGGRDHDDALAMITLLESRLNGAITSQQAVEARSRIIRTSANSFAAGERHAA